MIPLLLGFLLIIELTVAVAVWPKPPRMEIHWHQNCLYATNPETREGYGEPVNPCDRKYWDI